MRTIWINGRFLSQPLTGVQRYAQEITRELTCFDEVDVRIIAPRDASISALEPFVIRVGKLRGQAWEQLELPIALVKAGRPRLLNLANLAPLAYRDQIVTLHDIAYIKFGSSFSWKFRTLYRYLVPRLLSRSCHVITVSEFSRNEIKEAYPWLRTPVEVVHNAASKHFQPKNAKSHEARYILAVSSLTEQKNFVRLMEAFSALPAELDVYLYIVGGSAQAFANIRPDLFSDERIRMLGRVSDDELLLLYQGALAFVFPTLYEGFGIPPLEAQSCGCAVAASDIAPIRETLGDSALFFDPLSIEDITRNLIRLISDGELRKRLTALGAVNVQRFSWRASASRVLSIYEHND